MTKPGSSFNPTPLGHEDNLRFSNRLRSYGNVATRGRRDAVLSPSATEVSPCGGGPYTLNLSRLNVLPFVW
ncbi:hypothetical protein TNCV_3011601 [Trichonephila clavipes]|nr:hypothetical protein TNCV_3011601 [Trichonephila clavipes]